MKLVRGQLQSRIDSSQDRVITVFKERFSQTPIKDSVVALLFYGSRLFGNTTSDYDLDLILSTFSPQDFQVIQDGVAAARRETMAVIDFEVYYRDLLDIDERFTTGAQGCYFLFSWAYADAIIGSTGEFKSVLGKIPARALQEDLDRKVKNYFGRIQHMLVNEQAPDLRAVRKNLTRAIYHTHLLLGNWGYDDIYGFSTDSLLRKEVSSPKICTSEMEPQLHKLLDGSISREEAYTLANQVHKRYRTLVSTQMKL